MIRNGILFCGQKEFSGSELETPLLYTQAIKDVAETVGLHDISKLSEILEFEITAVVLEKRSPSDAQIRRLLDKLAQIEALLAKIRSDGDNFPLNPEGLVEKSFDNPYLEKLNKETEKAAEIIANFPENAPENEVEEFEIDEEMLEVFAEEAEDLLQNIQSNLTILKSEPDNREALLEIRRNAHTLKGSAGIVGLKLLSDLAHRVEDLLDFLSENEIKGNEKILELLMASTDCLSALANGEKSPQLTARISQLYQKFNETLNLLKFSDEWKNSFSLPKAETKPASSVSLSAANENTVNESGLQTKSVIRISLEKIDELVRLVSNLIINRSAFERRLVEVERQIGELHYCTERLKRSIGKIETDFEASLLGENSFGFLSDQSSPQFFDSLEFDRYTEFHQTTRELLETTGDAVTINAELEKLRNYLDLLFTEQNCLIEQLQDKLLRLRMVSFGSLSARLHRTVRIICEEEGKQAELFIEGENTEIDTQILDSLVEPLLHLLRNAVAHGIESPDTRRLLGKPEKGKISLKIQSNGTQIILSVADDGHGISASALKEKAVQNGFITKEEAEKMNDEETFALCFLPGLTTAEKLSQTAGRGVGMNIIRASILRQQGTISVSSELQKGTTFTIRLPMSLAVTRGLLVRSGGQTFAFPLKLVRKISEMPATEFENLQNFALRKFDGSDYLVSHLNKLLKQAVSDPKRENLPVLLLETLETQQALLVEEVIRTEEIVIKPLGSPLPNLPHLLGVTILGDGSVVPVLDLIYLLNNQDENSVLELQNSQEKPDPETESTDSGLFPTDFTTLKVLIVDDSPSVRQIMSKLIKNSGWEAILARNGLEALNILAETEQLPDVVLTDVEMPQMDGYELLAALKSHETFQNIPVIMITSRASEKHRQKAFELGVTEYLTKPFDNAVLIEKIKTLTGEKVVA